MSVAAYVLASVIWGLAGLIVGFLLGRARPVYVMEVPMTVPATATPADPSPPRTGWRRWINFDRIIGAAVVLLAVLSVSFLAVTINRQEAAITCQSAFNERFIAALRERSDAATTERAAQRDLLTAVITPGDNARAAIQRYLDGLAAADAQRDATPLPDRPDCGDGGS